jgi:hypothetical protein
VNLEVALRGVFDAEEKLRSSQGVNSPVFMSENMMRLSSYAGAVEEQLAEYEKDFEMQSAHELRKRLLDKGMKVTQAEREVDIVLAEQKGQIKYLTRIVASAWKQVGTTQSRFNHLQTLAGTQV